MKPVSEKQLGDCLACYGQWWPEFAASFAKLGGVKPIKSNAAHLGCFMV